MYLFAEDSNVENTLTTFNIINIVVVVIIYEAGTFSVAPQILKVDEDINHFVFCLLTFKIMLKEWTYYRFFNFVKTANLYTNFI